MKKEAKTRKIMIRRQMPLRHILKLGNVCRRCGHCCRHGSGALGKGDLKRIAGFLEMREEDVKERYLDEDEKLHTTLLKPRLIRKEGLPYGRCVFLSDKEGCSINKVKPLQCRTGNCTAQGEELNLWFMMNHYLNEDDPESVRQYASYLKCGGRKLPGAELERLVPDKKRLRKILDYDIIK